MHAIASFSACIAVSGTITEAAIAEDHARIYGHGNTQNVIAKKESSIIIGGNPKTVESTGLSNIIIFGSPHTLFASDEGMVTVVTSERNYQPSEVEINNYGQINIIQPRHAKQFPKDSFLLHHLESIYPEHSDEYRMFYSILRNFKSQSLRVAR